MSEEKSGAQPKIIAGLSHRPGRGPKQRIPVKSRKVIQAANVVSNPEKVRIIGGDSDDFDQNLPPAIILEKDHDQIARIIVKCPCGRHAELVCEYTAKQQ